MFVPESHYSICGYDTFGFVMFQCLILGADGQLDLLTRAPELRQALQTFALNDLQIDMRSYVILVSAAKILPVLLLI